MSHSIKKQILLILLAVVLALSLVVMFTACNNQHEHTYSTEWTTDADYHWHAATCEHTSEKSGLAVHSDNNDDGRCDTCDYELTHKHTFNETYWLWDSESHWRIATCEHTEEKGSLGAHIDENSDNKCDICEYPISTHEHSYSESWESNETEHWLPATCEHTDLKSSVGAHVDINEDEHCDVCFRELPHVDTFSEDWTYDETNHWHAATCRHKELTSGNAIHSFVSGVCECGVKQSEVDVYAIYAEHTSRADSFVDWLTALEEAGVVEVRKTPSGDAVYEYSDGTVEAIYVAERTFKVEAITAEGQGVAHVWIMVSLYKDGAYQEVNGSIALGLAETDDSGVAEISFYPVAGYTDDNVSYGIRIAERKDIASFLGENEEEVSNPIPNRYFKSDNSIGVANYVVGEEIVGKEIVAQFTFEFSRGWNAYEKFTLPYARYYEKPLQAEGLKEEGFTFEFTASGDNLFDYFYFTPANKYSFESASATTPPDQLLIIEQNFALAASGYYTLSFEVEGDATATLYYWNASGVNLGAHHDTNANGTPADKYITSLSGGAAGTIVGSTGKYTGGNFVNVVIEPEEGLRMYQLGLRTDTVCKVTVTVERTGDFIVDEPDYVVDWNEAVDGVYTSNKKVSAKYYDTTIIALNGVPAGLYEITLDNNNYDGLVVIPGIIEFDVVYGGNDAEALKAYTDTDKTNKITVYEGTKAKTSNGNDVPDGAEFRFIIRITEDTKKLYFDNGIGSGSGISTSGILIIKPYELPTLTVNESVYLPVTNLSAESYQIPLDGVLNGVYNISVIVCGVDNGGTNIPLTINIGNRVVSLSNVYEIEVRGTYLYTGTITFESGDSTITFTNSVSNSFMANVTLIPIT